MNAQELQDRLTQLPAEIQSARKAARKERAQAIFDGRKADPAILERPAELEQERAELPDTLFDLKVRSLKKTRDDQAAKVEKLQADKKSASDRMNSATEAKEAADREYRDADRAHSGADRNLGNAKLRVQDADSKLADLYENGLDSGSPSTPAA